MTEAQLRHGLALADDLRRVVRGGLYKPGEIIEIRTSIRDLLRAQRRLGRNFNAKGADVKPKTVDEIRGEYVQQIISASTKDGAHQLVGMLLDEYGAKAYSQGWNNAFDQIRKTMDEWKR